MDPALLLADEDALEASLCADSLRDFTHAAWPLVVPAEPLIWGWHLDAICEHLEAITHGYIRRLVINVPPRHMKSLLVEVFWPAWEWVKHPELHYLTVSHSGPLATRDARRSRLLMQSEGLYAPEETLMALNHGQPSTLLQRIGYKGLLKAVDNEWDFAGDQNLKSRYENDRRGVRIAVGLVGGSTGEGGHRICIDDPHKLEEWDSENKLKGAVEFVTGVAPSRLNSKDAAIVLIMQRVHELDSTAAVRGEIEDVEGWGEEVVHLCLPEEYEPTHPFTCPADVPVGYDDDGELVEILGDPREEPGEPIWPERYGPVEIAEHKMIGSMKYAGNYRQFPSPAEGNVFLKGDWRHYGFTDDRDLPPTWERIVFSWDLTFGESEDPGASYVCGQCWGKDGPDAFLLAMIRARMSFPAMKIAVAALPTIAPLDHAGGRGQILVEEKAAGKPLLEEIRLTIPGLKGVVPTVSKMARAVAVQPYQEGHNLYLPRSVIPAPDGYEPVPTSLFVDEHAAFPTGKNNDMVDTMSQALQELFHTRADEAGSVSAGPDRGTPTVKRGGKTFVGEKYVDEEPPEASAR